MEPVARRTRRRRDEALLKQYRECKKTKSSSNGNSEDIIVLSRSSSETPASKSSSSSRSVSSDCSPVPHNVRKEESDDEDDIIVLSRSSSETPASKSPSSLRSVSSNCSPVPRNVKKEESDDEDVVMYVSPQKAVSPIVITSSSGSEESSQSEEYEDSGSSDHLGSEESDYTEEGAEAEAEEDEVKEEDKISSFGTIDRPIVLGAHMDDHDEDCDSLSHVSVKDSEIGETAEICTRAKGCVIDDDDDEEEEETEEEEEEEEVVVKKDKAVMRQSKGPLTATEMQRVLLNSIMEEANTDVEEEAVKKPHENEESRSKSSCSSEVDSGEEMEIKDPQQEEIDSLYNIMNFCLVGDEAATETCLADEDSKKNQEQLCKEGKHHLILDEEIGVICKLCSYIREEIRHVMPPFHDNPFGVSDHSGYYMHDYKGPKNLPYFQDSNIEYQHFKDDDEFDTTGTVWEIIPGLIKDLFPQQREAFEFIWRNVGGGTVLDDLKKKKTSDGGGCLISHAPGTGKTRLSIAFLQTYMKFSKNSRPVVLAPASILLSWKQEFEKWEVDLPFLNLNEKELSKTEMSIAGSLFGRSNLKNLDLMAKRLIKLLFWKRHESVLAVSYTLFAMLAAEDDKKPGSSSLTAKQNELLRELLLETPGILILDEAHMPRNERSRMFKVLKKVKTKKRILLSGTFFQNNFRELRNILCLVRKEFNDEIDHFKKSGVDESDEGKIRDLREKMKPFCHCCGNDMLLKKLRLIENKIYLQPSEHQKRLLKYEEEHRKGHLEENVNMTLISIHPMLFHCKGTHPDFKQELKSGKWDVNDGAKTRFLIRLIQLSSALEERVLVFSQYIDPLNFIKAILQSERFGWREGIQIHLMNGSQDMDTRKRTMDLFNKAGSEAKVMLASTKACSEGIELTGASRVVLLDVTWNPAVEKQAVCRAFRMGQKRAVHVYHLIMTDNDSNRHFSQSQKNNFSNYMFSLNNKKSDGHQSSTDAGEDVILERLREENIIQEATQETTGHLGRHNRF